MLSMPKLLNVEELSVKAAHQQMASIQKQQLIQMARDYLTTVKNTAYSHRANGTDSPHELRYIQTCRNYIRQISKSTATRFVQICHQQPPRPISPHNLTRFVFFPRTAFMRYIKDAKIKQGRIIYPSLSKYRHYQLPEY